MEKEYPKCFSDHCDNYARFNSKYCEDKCRQKNFRLKNKESIAKKRHQYHMDNYVKKEYIYTETACEYHKCSNIVKSKEENKNKQRFCCNSHRSMQYQYIHRIDINIKKNIKYKEGILNESREDKEKRLLKARGAYLLKNPPNPKKIKEPKTDKLFTGDEIYMDDILMLKEYFKTNQDIYNTTKLFHKSKRVTKQQISGLLDLTDRKLKELIDETVNLPKGVEPHSWSDYKSKG